MYDIEWGYDISLFLEYGSHGTISTSEINRCQVVVMDFFYSVEFYVIATLIAAVIVALALRPSSRGEARQYLLAGSLMKCDVATAEIELEAFDDFSVRLVRRAIPDVTAAGAVSLAVTIIGFDIKIEERIVYGRNPMAESVDTAIFLFDFLAPERYHIQYVSEPTGLFVSTTFNNRPGYRIVRQLTR